MPASVPSGSPPTCGSAGLGEIVESESPIPPELVELGAEGTVLRRGPLDLVESRWDEATFQEVGSVLMGDELLMSFGRGTSSDGRMTVIAVLLHLPARLARRLSQFQPAILDLQVLAKPA